MALKKIKSSVTPTLSMDAIGRLRSQPRQPLLEAKHAMRYDDERHSRQPHILKFSGGRSSGMLLFTLLDNMLLDPGRGDVIIFNNTSAEHPATYAFVAECKRIAEKTYGIPFFWLQFQTYEDMGRAGWSRFPTYRLVKPTSWSPAEPDGYDNTGAVFEEMLAWKGYVPNIHSRICTETLKLFVTAEFVRDWLGNRNDLFAQGHTSKPKMKMDQVGRHHQWHGGTTPKDVLAKKKSFLRKRPVGRPQQYFASYTDCTLGDRKGAIKGVMPSGGRATLSGDKVAEYVSLVGFRADEPHRLAKMRERNKKPDSDEASMPSNVANGDFRASGYGRSDGEHVYAPLECMGVDREDVANYWKLQSVKLHLPVQANFSNCVFCFLKGKPTLQNLLSEQSKLDNNARYPAKFKSTANSQLTPMSIDWWSKMEKRYARDLLAEGRVSNDAKNEKRFIGFFGLAKSSSLYSGIKKTSDPQKAKQQVHEQLQSDCACTD